MTLLLVKFENAFPSPLLINKQFEPCLLEAAQKRIYFILLLLLLSTRLSVAALIKQNEACAVNPFHSFLQLVKIL